MLIKDDNVPGKCNTIWDEVSADIIKEFDNEPVYDKIKSHDDEVTDFYDKKNT